ncbi:hypothetical protein GH754_02245 [Salinibacillus xinjiangensis]|uniref:Uncharacterized protein n=1 Tax=Salinibacillus xinjiangensis TaxID=1229268 RepID=A0A6G1X2H8_9BACI|nr:hypothetical protein [Salinibacillus xinjiangensis]
MELILLKMAFMLKYERVWLEFTSVMLMTRVDSLVLALDMLKPHSRALDAEVLLWFTEHGADFAKHGLLC